jgi:hypothetical protein
MALEVLGVESIDKIPETPTEMNTLLQALQFAKDEAAKIANTNPGATGSADQVQEKKTPAEIGKDPKVKKLW